MAMIKVSAATVRMACTDYKRAYDERVAAKKEENKDDDEYAWIEDTVNGNNANVVARIRKMACIVYDTQYPYVMLSYDDCVLLGKHLEKHGIN